MGGWGASEGLASPHGRSRPARSPGVTPDPATPATADSPLHVTFLDWGFHGCVWGWGAGKAWPRRSLDSPELC